MTSVKKSSVVGQALNKLNNAKKMSEVTEVQKLIDGVIDTLEHECEIEALLEHNYNRAIELESLVVEHKLLVAQNRALVDLMLQQDFTGVISQLVAQNKELSGKLVKCYGICQKLRRKNHAQSQSRHDGQNRLRSRTDKRLSYE